MTIDVDKYLERSRLKVSRGRWRVISLLAIIALIVLAIGKFESLKSGDHVAVIDINNIIIDNPERDRVLKKIARDPNAKALIIRISSPGGTVVGAESLYYFLRSVSKNKPVVAVLRELATSAGYMIALGADYIFARQSTITGSVGVLMQSTDITELLKKVGIKPDAIKSSPLKAQPNPLEPFSKEARVATRAIVTDIHKMFIDLVAERRNLKKPYAETLSDGRIYTGRQAVANGLIDALGGEDEARLWLDETKGIQKNIPQKKISLDHEQGILREILGNLVGKTLFYERLRLDGLISLWQPTF